jgi:hypothetical protein
LNYSITLLSGLNSNKQDYIIKKPISVDDLLINVESVCDESANRNNIKLILPFDTKLKVVAE